MTKRPLSPVGFWSYARPDDELSGGQLSRLRSLIRAELQQQYGREQIQLFQDISAISHGSRWEGEIRRALNNSTFFIPIISPNFLQSEWCVQEVEIFQERQERLFDEFPDLPRTSRIFPVHYIDVTGVEALNPRVDAALRELQWFDFREFRHLDFGAGEVRRTVSGFVTSVRDLLRVQVEQADEVSEPVSVSRPAPVASPESNPVSLDGDPPATGRSRMPLVIAAVAGLIAVAALIAFLVLRGGGQQAGAPANAVAPTAPPASPIANGSAATAPDTAELDALNEELVAGRWGENSECTGRTWIIRPDGTFQDDQPGQWTIADGRLTIVDAGGTWEATLDIIGQNGQILHLTPVNDTASEQETWYLCAAGENGEPQR